MYGSDATALRACPMQGERWEAKGIGRNKLQKIPTIDFVEWLVRSVNPEDFVVLKFDIEGAEFEVVEKMVSSG